MHTSTGLVKYVKQALKEDWGYCLGSYGNILTPAFLAAKQRQGYGVGAYNRRHDKYLRRYLNKMVADCYGLVKGYVFPEDSRGSAKYVGRLDRNQEGAFRAARVKGPLSSLPETPGAILWMPGHAGIYIGNGEFIECVGAPIGMRKGTIRRGRITSGSRFTHWFLDTYIKYDGTTTSTPPAASKPSKPTASKESLKVDGYWGPSTTRALQRALKTHVDGVISGQYQNRVTNSIPSVSYTSRGGSSMARALQKKVGAPADGFIGSGTVRAMQKYLGTYVDGLISSPSNMVKELQRRLNAGTF